MRFRPELVILDRDGVLNQDRAEGIRSVAEWSWISGAAGAVQRLAGAGIRLMVVTNQANIGRGVIDHGQLEAIHRHMLSGLQPAPLSLGDILYCPHVPEQHCSCRKPQPGMLETAMHVSGVEASRTLMIGDQAIDISAAAAAGCWSQHVQSGRGDPPTAVGQRYLGSVKDLDAVARRVTKDARS